MATRKDTMDFVLRKLGHPGRFSARAMFGEFAVYADGKVVALVCDDQLYVKVLPASAALAKTCEKASPFPGAKAYYLVSEDQLSSLSGLAALLLGMAERLPLPKKKKRATRG